MGTYWSTRFLTVMMIPSFHDLSFFFTFVSGTAQGSTVVLMRSTGKLQCSDGRMQSGTHQLYSFCSWACWAIRLARLRPSSIHRSAAAAKRTGLEEV